MASEVGLYKRPSPMIRITDDNPTLPSFLFRILKVSGMGFSMEVRGNLTMHGVRMENGGYPAGGASIGETIAMLLCEGDSICDITSSVLEPRVGGAVRAIPGSCYSDACRASPLSGDGRSKLGLVLSSGIAWRSKFEHNVVLETRAAFWLRGQIQFSHNIVFGIGGVTEGAEEGVVNPEQHDPASPAGAINIGDDGRRMTVIGNAVAGWPLPRPAFGSMGFAIPRSRFKDNSAHGVDMGWAIKGSITQTLQDLTLWGVGRVAIYGYSTSDTPRISNVRVADAATSFWWVTSGADPEKHTVRQQTITIEKSLFVGASLDRLRACTAQQYKPHSQHATRQTGIMLPVGVSVAYSIEPNICANLGGEYMWGAWGLVRVRATARPDAEPFASPLHCLVLTRALCRHSPLPRPPLFSKKRPLLKLVCLARLPCAPASQDRKGSNPPLALDVRVTGNTFRRFVSTCGVESAVFEQNMVSGDLNAMDSSDVVPPVYLSKTDIDAISRQNLAHLPPPKRDWVEETRCVVMDCDGPKKILIHDLDGTTTGSGKDSSILARAEFMARALEPRTLPKGGLSLSHALSLSLARSLAHALDPTRLLATLLLLCLAWRAEPAKEGRRQVHLVQHPVQDAL